MSKPDNYGRYYWCVKTDLSKEGEIYLHADDVIVENGDLIFMNSEGHINLCLARGEWKAFFAASVLDGAAVAVEYWKGEVERN